MYKSSPIQLHVRQAASSLGENIRACHRTLEELRRLSLILFTHTKASAADIQDWFQKEGFGIDSDGFWTPLPLLQAYREKKAPRDAISFSWHPGLAKHPEACFRMYCLRQTGPYLEDISGKLPHAEWIYYQDVTNTSIQFPYIDQATAITADFDWSTYHTYVSVAPENNPQKAIRWTSPTIDYAGEGLIVSASIPVYLSDRFIGLWSIDLPMKSLYKEVLIEQPYLKSQVNFIMDKDGFLVTHPTVALQIDKEKGSIYRGHVYDLGKMFESLDPKRLLSDKSGQFMLSDGTGDETVAWFEAIPGIQWIFLATLPRKSMEDAVNRRIREALDRVKFGDLSHRIKETSDVDQARMVAEGFNQVVFYQDIVKESLKLLRASVPKNIDILTNIAPDCPPVLGDPTRLHQIIMNLCTNAFHALEEKGGAFEVSLNPVTLSEDTPPGLENLAPGNFVRLTVSDNGPGIDASILSKIFDPYFTTKGENKGTGLGLSIAYGIVRKLKGDIKVYSEPGKGTAFHVYLPATDAVGISKKQTDPLIPGGKERILLVDDESSIVDINQAIRNIMDNPARKKKN